MKDSDYMQVALDLALRGTGHTAPNPLVGAVVVRDDEIVGKGFHERFGGPHAEVHALDDAGSRADGATLYVTLEPCNHSGKTPPCTQRILQAGIRRVVVAMEDPNPHVTGQGGNFLRTRGVTVETGVCRKEAEAINEFFIKHVTTGRPFVIAKCAATLDGRIATARGDSRWVTGDAARTRVHEIRQAVDAILVGVGTVEADDPSLTTRLPDIATVDPVRVILDTNLRIDPSAKVLRLASDSDTIIFTSPDVDAGRRRKLEGFGVQVIPVSLRDGRIDLATAMELLGKRGITSVLIEGGSRVLAAVFQERIADKVMFFYAPKILGGGIPICRGQGPERMADATIIRDARVHLLGSDILVEGYISASAGFGSQSERETHVGATDAAGADLLEGR